MKSPLGPNSPVADLEVKIICFKLLRKPENAELRSADIHVLQDLPGKTLVDERAVPLRVTRKFGYVPVAILAQDQPRLRSTAHATPDTCNTKWYGVQSSILKAGKGVDGGASTTAKSTMCIPSDP
jgi:hypothetical protein